MLTPNSICLDRKATGITTRRSGDPEPAKVLIVVNRGIVSFHTVGEVAVHLVDLDCIAIGDYQEVPVDFEQDFPRELAKVITINRAILSSNADGPIEHSLPALRVAFSNRARKSVCLKGVGYVMRITEAIETPDGLMVQITEPHDRQVRVQDRDGWWMKLTKTSEVILKEV